MKKVIRDLYIKKTYYIAKDSTEFESKDDCMFHEWRTTATIVYLPITRGRRGVYNDDVEIYSTMPLAKAALADLDSGYHIASIYLNERNWREEYNESLTNINK